MSQRIKLTAPEEIANLAGVKKSATEYHNRDPVEYRPFGYSEAYVGCLLAILSNSTLLVIAKRFLANNPVSE